MKTVNKIKEPIKISSEKLAYWYFRLNGCLTIENFVVHPDWEAGQQTEIDLIAVRFPYRAELLGESMIDDTDVFSDNSRVRIIFTEVKKGPCNLNPTWTTPSLRNMQRILQAVGSMPIRLTPKAAERRFRHSCHTPGCSHAPSYSPA